MAENDTEKLQDLAYTLFSDIKQAECLSKAYLSFCENGETSVEEITYLLYVLEEKIRAVYKNFEELQEFLKV